MKLTLDQVRDFLQAALTVADEVIEAKRSLKDAQSQAEKVRSISADLMKRSEGVMQEAKVVEARAAKILANAEASAKETDDKAQAKYQQVVSDASAMKAKAQAYVDSANEQLKQLRDEIANGQAELVAMNTDLEKTRKSIREFLVRS